jgi:hypothetical protein
MKKFLLLVSAVIMFAGQMFANPVDVNTAKTLGAKYLKNNVLSAKNIADVEHVYTLNSDNGTPYLYVFNHEKGYVVVAADDRAYPILGYGEGAAFDVNNIPDGLRYFLGHYGRQIQYAIDNELVAEQDVVEQWELLRKEGIIMKTRMENVVTPLLATTWNQDWPYNYYAPACQSYWTNNHCYAGCVATAMSQVMKYWNWPETGVGEHSYSTSTYGGTLSANFGETTYNWSIMPNSLGSSATTAAQAVALLMYHCGIAVDMDYDPSGSGAHTEDIPGAVVDYFRYGAGTYVDARDYYTKTAWEDKLIALLDRGIPMVYAGADTDGGHAFNCDGYNAQRYFNFNWGWSGSYNNYYQIDALNTGNGHFNSSQRAVFDMVPDYIYEAMVPAIETMEVAVVDAITKTAIISFTVPAVSESGAALTSIAKIEIKRNGTVIKTYNNPQPGEQITYEDTVSDYGSYEYTIVGENDNIKGKSYSQTVMFGPNCTWKVTCQTTNFQGWNNGMLQFCGSNGTVFHEVTMTNSSPFSEKFQIPEGTFTIKWVAPTSTVSSLTITLKNSANQQTYNFSGASTQLSGTIYTGNNDCEGCTAPTAFAGQYAYEEGLDGTLLTWNCSYTPSNFKVYRSEDGVEYEEIAKIDGSLNEYFDGVNVVGNYYYQVTAYSSTCESTPAITADDTDFVIVEVLDVPENSIDARIYPNPANDNLMIHAEGITEVVVMNSLGQIVYRFSGSTEALDIDTTSLEAGIYMVNVKTVKGMTTDRIVIMH